MITRSIGSTSIGNYRQFSRAVNPVANLAIVTTVTTIESKKISWLTLAARPIKKE